MLKLLVIYMVISQGPDTAWTKTFGGANIDNSWSVKEDSEHNFIIAGWTMSYGAGIFDGYVIKTDSMGNMLWHKTFGGALNDVFFDVETTTDGGYIFAGYTRSYGSGEADFYVIKTDIDGNQIWSKTYGGANSEYAYSIKETQDGGYIIVGYSNSFAPYYDVYIIKTYSNGDIVWTKTIGGDFEDYGRDVIEVSDGYVLCGYTQSFGSGNDDLYIVKINLNGDSLWAKFYGGTDYDAGYSIVENSNNELIITGYTHSYGAGFEDVYLVKTDSYGNIIWQKEYGGADNERGWKLVNSSGGGYTITGYTTSYGMGGNDVYLIRTDEDGNELWYKTYGGADNDYGYSIDITHDTGYIVSGGTWSFGSGNTDVYLLRLLSEDIEEKSSFPINKDAKIIFNPSLDKFYINYTSKKECEVELGLFNLTGSYVKTLWKGKVSKGKNYFTSSLKSGGIYIIMLKEKNKLKWFKLIYLK